MDSNLSFEIKIVYDNICHEKGFLTGFGFSALIYNHFTQNYALFDTGAKSDVLFNNINMFNVNISDIERVISLNSPNLSLYEKSRYRNLCPYWC